MIGLEIKHLRAIQAIATTGSLGAASEVLHLTQPALSQQIKALETRLGMAISQPKTKPMQLSPTGLRLLDLANDILPIVAKVEAEFRAQRDGETRQLRLGLECTSCLDWLLPVITRFQMAWPDMNVELKTNLKGGLLQALSDDRVDLIFSTQNTDLRYFHSVPILDYMSQFICAKSHALAEQEFIVASDLRDQTLYTSTTTRAHSDVFVKLLDPAGIVPREHRVEDHAGLLMFHIMSGRGVAALPDWVIKPYLQDPRLSVLPIGPQGLTCRIYATLRKTDLDQSHISHFNTLARQGFRLRRI